MPEHRRALQFESRAGMLRNILTREVPRLAADNALAVLNTVLDRARVTSSDVGTWIMHAGGRDVRETLVFPW